MIPIDLIVIKNTIKTILVTTPLMVVVFIGFQTTESEPIKVFYGFQNLLIHHWGTQLWWFGWWHLSAFNGVLYGRHLSNNIMAVYGGRFKSFNG